MNSEKRQAASLSGVTFEYRTGDDLEPVREEIVDVYLDAFSPPPYNRTKVSAIDFADTFIQHAQRESFRLVTAVDDSRGRMLGFGYGHTAKPGQWWHDLVYTALGLEERLAWLSHAFVLVELAVRPVAQGRGIGGHIHDLLLAGLPHRTAVLSTIGEDTTAFHLYIRRGWGMLIDNFMFPNVANPYRIMGIDLRRDSRDSSSGEPLLNHG